MFLALSPGGWQLSVFSSQFLGRGESGAKQSQHITATALDVRRAPHWPRRYHVKLSILIHERTLAASPHSSGSNSYDHCRKYSSRVVT